MKKFGIKSLILINVLLAMFLIAQTAKAQEINNPTQVEQVEGHDKLKNLMERIQQEKLELKKEIEELKQKPHTLINIELVGVSDEGQYWYDETAEYEPIIYVDWGTAEKFGVEDYELGNTSVGIFDEEGWELFGFDRF